MTFTVGGKHRLSRALTGLLVVSALLTSGCFSATGGGWIPSMTGADKATFGFSARCRTMQQNGNPVAELYDGQLEWHDGPVRFHGKVEPIVLLTEPGLCDDVSLPTGLLSFGGTYEPHTGGPAGEFIVEVNDLGEPGKINGDFISIKLVGGFHGGYTNAGMLQGGNIQVF